ncbi:hypothetical protein ES332_D12G264200v1 [Gossypium tomentosum]|uniref:ATP-dependent Clp protease proteolytic subunit n=1 Tax=Gossypium tomentosum TaxID=34277 RepID=A0A5D2IE37_GOSTO|nr:hypothetical protein ES332_D12G264200v1 [Gossypium tomentosum]
MAISLNTNLHQPSLSSGTKVYSGLKLQSPCLFATGRPNLTADFYTRVNKSLQCGLLLVSKNDVCILFLVPRKRKIASFNAKLQSNKVTSRMMPIGTPRVPYRVPGEGTWQWVDLWNALYRERVIFIGQHIDEEFSNQIWQRCYTLILTPSLAIYDTMKSLKSPVGTHCVGYAYNVAGFLLAAGEKGNRFAMPLSRVALQSPAGAARGQADDIRNEANELLRIRDYLFTELAKNTGQPVEKVNKDLSRMKRFNAQEALEYGLIDRIVRPPRIKADAPRKDAGTGLG